MNYKTNTQGFIYTGFKDKNGTEIYDNDLLEYNDGSLQVTDIVALDKGCFKCDGQPLFELALATMWEVITT